MRLYFFLNSKTNIRETFGLASWNGVEEKKEVCEQSVTAWRVRSGGNIYLVVVASTAFLFRYATQMQMQMQHTFTDACMDGYLSPSSVVAPSQPPFSLHKSDIESSVLFGNCQACISSWPFNARRNSTSIRVF